MPYQTLLRTLVAALTLTAATAARGQEDRAADREAIRAAAQRYVQAVQSGDTATVAKMWTTDGDYVDTSGQRLRVRQLLEALGQTESEPAQSQPVELSESDIRFLGDDVAIEDGAFTSEAGSGGSFTAVWVRQQGRWLLDALRETATADASTTDHLSQLDWLLGEWVAEVGDTEMFISSSRVDNGHFILREFMVLNPNQLPFKGTQRIGYDAASGQFRCWQFDSNGGFGQGIWRQAGDRWIVELQESLPTGHQLMIRSVHVPGEDKIVWETEGLSVENQEIAGQRVEFQRAPADQQ